MYGYNDNAAFNPNEICKILDIKNNTDRLTKIRKDHEFICPFPGHMKYRPQYNKQDIILVTERGMHEIIMGSNSKIATELKDFISDILKNIRIKG